MNLVNKHINQIKELCVKHRVKKLYVFGSVLTDRFRPESDIDFIVMFKPMGVLDRGECYLDLCEGLEDLFNRKIDLISKKSITNPYFLQAVEQTMQLIYEADPKLNSRKKQIVDKTS